MTEPDLQAMLTRVAEDVPPPDLAARAWSNARRLRRRRRGVVAGACLAAAAIALPAAAMLWPGSSGTQPGVSATPSLATSAPGPTATGAGTVEGTLLDGTRYRLHVPDLALVGEVQQVNAAPVVDDGDGVYRALGVTSWRRVRGGESGPRERPTLVGSTFYLPAGRWEMVVEVYPERLALVGDLLRDQVFLDRIRVDEHAGLPVVALPSPLRLAGADVDIAYEMEVMYEHLIVTAGCVRSPDVVCSPDGTVSVSGLVADQPMDGITITTA